MRTLLTPSLEVMPYGFRDLDGNPLPPFTFSFTTAKAFDTLRIPADPAKGFQWPYYLAIPDTLAQNKVLLVAPNNSGFVSDDPWEHESAAQMAVFLS